MKTSKPGSNTRRSLRNIGNDSKTTKGKIIKRLPVKVKLPSEGKPQLSKSPQRSTPTKLTSQVSKRKKVPEEVPPESPSEEVVDTKSEEQNTDTKNIPKPEKTVKPKVKRTKKKKESTMLEDHGWRTLDELSETVLLPDDSHKKSVNSQKGDRRKQSLVVRDVICPVMVQTHPIAVLVPKDDSDCEMLDGSTAEPNQISNLQTSSEAIEVDLDDGHSEAGSNFCEIIDEPGSGFDYRRLYAQASHVSLPSSLWACHLDPRKEFLSFTRYNPDFPSRSNNVVDRVVVFKGSLKPSVFCNGEDTMLPDEIHSVETITDISQVLQHLNAMVLP